MVRTWAPTFHTRKGGRSHIIRYPQTLTARQMRQITFDQDNPLSESWRYYAPDNSGDFYRLPPPSQRPYWGDLGAAGGWVTPLARQQAAQFGGRVLYNHPDPQGFARFTFGQKQTEMKERTARKARAAQKQSEFRANLAAQKRAEDAQRKAAELAKYKVIQIQGDDRSGLYSGKSSKKYNAKTPHSPAMQQIFRDALQNNVGIPVPGNPMGGKYDQPGYMGFGISGVGDLNQPFDMAAYQANRQQRLNDLHHLRFQRTLPARQQAQRYRMEAILRRTPEGKANRQAHLKMLARERIARRMDDRIMAGLYRNRRNMGQKYPYGYVQKPPAIITPKTLSNARITKPRVSVQRPRR